ncbi:MAG: ATP-binding protein [Deltaproteobacteria bacterium]|nr:ATP-binding protein [Deltaproteobacteria bacterium]
MQRAVQELVAAGDVLVAQVDLMATPSTEKLAQSIYDDVASPLLRVRDRAVGAFRGLRVTPRITLDPDSGSVSFSSEATAQREDIDATLERLFQLPGEIASRERRVALVFDEFQEVVGIDPGLTALMRASFQVQPRVAHVCLGSKRSMLERIFNDAN